MVRVKGICDILVAEIATDWNLNPEINSATFSLLGMDVHNVGSSRTKKFDRKAVNNFLSISLKHLFWVHERTVSSRRFF